VALADIGFYCLGLRGCAAANMAEATGFVMDNGKPVDRPSRQTVKVRQGTGPRSMVSVLLASLLIAAIAGAILLFYFLPWPTSTP
jgi:hypothetical protein